MRSEILKVYKKFSGLLGRINTKIILTVFYFAVIPLFKLFSTLAEWKKPAEWKNHPDTNWKKKDRSDGQSHEHSF